MKNKLLQYPKLSAFLIGWLTVAALPPFYIFPLLFLTFPTLLWLLSHQSGFWKTFKIGYTFGFAFFAFGLSWIGNALLIEAQTFGWLYPIVWLACGAFFGIFIAFPAALSQFYSKKICQYISFAAWWVIFEWIRSWFLTGFPWNLLGTTLAFSDTLIQSASFAGTYFLSLLVLLLTSAPFLFITPPNKKNICFVASLMVVLSASIYLHGYFRLKNSSSESGKTIIRIVQPAIPQTMKWNTETLQQNLQHYIDLSTQTDNHNISFTIWGETAVPFPQTIEAPQLQNITDAVPPHGYLITGLIRFTRSSNSYTPYNSMFVISPEGKINGFYDKSHLVPFGEYIPLRKYLPQWIRPIANAIGTFSAGDGPQSIRLNDFPSFGGLICYEIIFPGQIINPSSRPEWLINLTNDGWYGDSAGPRQHLVSTKLRAVEEGITIVRAANTGISALISPYGQIIKSINLNESGYIDVALPKQTQFSTTYSRYKNLTILILSIILILSCGRYSIKKE